MGYPLEKNILRMLRMCRIFLFFVVFFDLIFVTIALSIFFVVHLGRNSVEDSLSISEDMKLCSNFKNQNYICYGTCFCDDERRSVGSSIISKRIVYLLTATSSLFAISQAKNQFQKTCEKELSGSCSSVKGEVEDCQVEEREEEETRVTSDLMEKYTCEGNCLPNKDYLENIRTSYPLSKYFEIMKFLGQQCSSQSQISVEVIVSSIEHPEDIFLRDHLTPLCKEITSSVFSKFSQLFEGVEKETNVCVSHSSLRPPHPLGNSSIKCKGIVKRLDPCRLKHYKQMVPPKD